MTAPRIDTTLPMPPAPRRVPVLEGMEGVLALPGTAGARPFLAEAGLVRITGQERGGIDVISIGGHRVITDFTADMGGAANMVATPSSIRREVIGPKGSIQESALASPALPAAVVQWRGTGGQDFETGIALTVAPDMVGIRYRAHEHALVVQSDTGADQHVVVVHPTPTAWVVREAAGGGLAVRIEITAAAGEAVTLAAMRTSGQRPSPTALLEHLDMHERRAQSPPWDEGSVRIDTGVSELDGGCGWLAARIRPPSGAGSQSPLGLLWWGIGALACGLHDTAEAVMGMLTEAHPHSSHELLLGARIALTTGNQSHVRRLSAEVLASQGTGTGPGDGLTGVAIGALADALRYAASDEDIEALRHLSDRVGTPDADLAVKSGAQGVSLPVSLPMVGDEPVRAHLPPWLEKLITATTTESPTSAPLAQAAGLVRDLSADVPEAYGTWRSLLASGLSDGPAGRGSWDELAEAGTPVAGALVSGMMHGLLGVLPDGPVGRLELSPGLPPHMTEFAVRGIGVGDARLDMEYRRSEEEHTYVLNPTHARVPPTLVFSPRLAVRGVTAAFIDEEPAELDVVETRDRTTVRVQIPLDGRRTVRLCTAAPSTEA